MKLKILQKSIQDIEISSNNPKMADVPDRCTSIYGKDYTNGSVTHASPSVISQDKLAISPVTRPEDSGFKPLKTSSVVERSKQCVNRLSLTSRREQYPYFHRCIKPGLGSPSRKHDSQWQLDKSRKNITYQCSRIKGSVSSLKKLSKQKNSESDRQRHCGQLPEQTGGYTLMGHVSLSLAHLGLLQSLKNTHKSQTYSGLLKCHS